MKPFSFGPGAALAIFCAGPVFVVTLMWGSAIFQTSSAGRWQGSFGELLALVIFSLPFGTIVAAIPVILGGFLMGWLGVRSPVSRHPLIWGSAGILLALPIAAITAAPLTMEGAALFGCTGALCAILTRLGTSWGDETPPVSTDTHEGEVK